MMYDKPKMTCEAGIMDHGGWGAGVYTTDDFDVIKLSKENPDHVADGIASMIDTIWHLAHKLEKETGVEYIERVEKAVEDAGERRLVHELKQEGEAWTG